MEEDVRNLYLLAVQIPQNLKYFPTFPQTLATEFILPNTRAVMLEISDFMLKKVENNNYSV